MRKRAGIEVSDISAMFTPKKAKKSGTAAANSAGGAKSTTTGINAVVGVKNTVAVGVTSSVAGIHAPTAGSHSTVVGIDTAVVDTAVGIDTDAGVSTVDDFDGDVNSDINVDVDDDVDANVDVDTAISINIPSADIDPANTIIIA